MTTYFEDLTVGEEHAFGRYEVTREEIVDFASSYDPQPFHLDEEAARESFFGGLVASGWHTASMTMRLIVDEFLADAASIGSPGVDELRWREPVRPGDVLTARATVLEKDPEGSRHGGLARIRVETLAGDDVVMSMVALVLFAQRDRDE